MAPRPEVSGRAFLGLIRHVKDRRSPRLEDVIAVASPATREMFKTPIAALGWYPYEIFGSFLESIQTRVGRTDGSVFVSLGAATGKRDLGTVLRVYVALASAERLIRSCATIWPSYYRNAGRMEAVRWSPDDTVLRIYDFPQMHRAHCRLMEGWMRATMETIGFRVHPGAAETECPHRGGEFHEFRCTWEKAS